METNYIPEVRQTNTDSGSIDAKLSRRNFIKKVATAAGGVVMFGVGAERALKSNPDARKPQKRVESLDLDKGEKYKQDVYNAVIEGFDQAFLELNERNLRTIDQGTNGMVTGLAAGAVMAAGKAIMETAFPDEEEAKGPKISKILTPAIITGTATAIPGFTRKTIAEIPVDKFRKRLRQIQTKAEMKLVEIKDLRLKPSRDIRQLYGKTRDALIKELGFEDFDAQNISSIKNAAKKYAEKELKKIR